MNKKFELPRSYSKQAQIGKRKTTQTEKNIVTNFQLDDVYKEMGLFDTCEANIAIDCLKESKIIHGSKLGMTYAHREKRDWYKQPGRQQLLYAYDHTIRCCVPCHIKLEANKKLTILAFNRLRPIK